MSNALAIATVTQTLANVVKANLAGSRVNIQNITTLRPDNSALQDPETTPRINIFLYQVTPNTAARNADLPTRRADGTTLIRRPQLGLDLHYLFTFYGNDNTLEQQRLLGAVARFLHSQPALQRADIQTAEQTVDANNNNVLYLNSGLSSQIDLVRFTPINFSLEEMSKMWSVFLKTDYVLSLAYTATVVLIETDDAPPAAALPVLRRGVQVAPFSQSFIDAVVPQSVAPAPPATPTITLNGHGLALDNTAAFMTPGKTDPILTTPAAGATDRTVPIALPVGLRPGVNTVQLMQTVALPPGAPPSSPVLSQSNVAPFVLLPAVTGLTLASPGKVQAVIFPPAGPHQQVSLVLNQLGGTQAFNLPADPHTSETNTFTFGTSFLTGSVPGGTYLGRVSVDAAESRLTVDALGKFNGPTVII